MCLYSGLADRMHVVLDGEAVCADCEQSLAIKHATVPFQTSLQAYATLTLTK